MANFGCGHRGDVFVSCFFLWYWTMHIFDVGVSYHPKVVFINEKTNG